MVIKAKIVKFGNSKGVRLPKVILQQSQLGEDVELVAKPGKIIISVKKQDETKKFTDYSRLANDFDDKDWTW